MYSFICKGTSIYIYIYIYIYSRDRFKPHPLHPKHIIYIFSTYKKEKEATEKTEVSAPGIHIYTLSRSSAVRNPTRHRPLYLPYQLAYESRNPLPVLHIGIYVRFPLDFYACEQKENARCREEKGCLPATAERSNRCSRFAPLYFPRSRTTEALTLAGYTRKKRREREGERDRERERERERRTLPLLLLHSRVRFLIGHSKAAEYVLECTRRTKSRLAFSVKGRGAERDSFFRKECVFRRCLW